MRFNLCTRFGEISSWVLLNKICKDLISSLCVGQENSAQMNVGNDVAVGFPTILSFNHQFIVLRSSLNSEWRTTVQKYAVA